MKIFSPDQIRQLDLATVSRYYESPWHLMEHASAVLYRALGTLGFSKDDDKIIIFCGSGNNGGDGLALARMLHEAGFSVSVYLYKAQRYTAENISNQNLYRALGQTINELDPSRTLLLPRHAVYIDALFGTGLSRPLEEHWHSVFGHIFAADPKKIIAVDMPSGLMSNTAMTAGAPCLPADIVFTFQAPKLALLLPENQNYCASFAILDIGLDKDTASALVTDFELTDKEFVRSLVKEPALFSHKGHFGHVLIAGGQYGSMGAPVLSARAALRTGCGLVTFYVPKCGYTIVQTSVSEAMCLTDDAYDCISALPRVEKYNAVALGMGAGQSSVTERAVLNWLAEVPGDKLVLDADALNILARQGEPFLIIPGGAVLTPHPKELERLIGSWDSDYEKIEKTRVLAHRYQVTIVIKGAYSAVVVNSGKVYFNSTGNWGMATAGSGDTLSGMIAALIAQGYTPENAAIIGVYLHGSAGDEAAARLHPHSMVASDITEHIGQAYTLLYS